MNTPKDGSPSMDALAETADVEMAFVLRAADAGALSGGRHGPFSSEDAGRLRFLQAWDSAGLPVENVGELLQRDEISFSFLGVPWLQPQVRLEQTYEQLAEDRAMEVEVLLDIHEALGFRRPQATDHVRQDDLVISEWVQTFLASGARQEALLRLLHVYSGALRRIAQAEAEVFESEIEERLRAAGSTERDLIQTGGQVGVRMAEMFEQTLLGIYRRHRQHVWLDHSIGHIEIILESKGLYERLDSPPCVCFIDLAGYTRLTEEEGDRAAADIADRLASLVERISGAFKGRPVRWLGDGGMFIFPEPGAAVRASLEATEQASAIGLPPTHTGIHCGPVVFQDGDIYGRTVNVAARLSAAAAAGEVLISGSAASQLPEGIALDDLGMIELKGLADPLQTYRVIHQ
jgi:class 3 adenylate cyclase/DNA-binding transcriptional MerR regulator